MFTSQSNPLKAYETVSLDVAVQNASPHKLVLMLFDGANQAMTMARIGMVNNDIPLKGTSISRAIDIILNGLRVSLNREEGGQLAEDLYALYDYIGRRLLHANLHNDIGALDEAKSLLGEIHSAWIDISPEGGTQPVAGNSP